MRLNVYRKKRNGYMSEKNISKINYIICHYSEIGLKKGNRSFFEKHLVDNIKRVVDPSLIFFVKRISGRILISLTDQGIKSEDIIEESLGRVFGISSFLFCVKVNQDIKDIGKASIYLLKNKAFKTFRISSKRSEKVFLLTSQQINEEIGGVVLNQIKGLKVNLERPDIICYIEIVNKNAFISIRKVKGLGGLPIGTGGRAISLLSGGIDSPVASFMAMRRGVKIVFIHFHSYPETSESSIDKVRELVKILSRYQGQSKLYLVPFAEAQREILLNSSSGTRVIFYRRLMLRITSERTIAIVTGESLGQVASQTLENIRAIERGTIAPIIRPLICEDKESIINKAKEIGTFETSILPHDDCCARFIPRNPETKADVDRIIEEEKKLDVKKITDKAVKNISCEIIKA